MDRLCNGINDDPVAANWHASARICTVLGLILCARVCDSVMLSSRLVQRISSGTAVHESRHRSSSLFERWMTIRSVLNNVRLASRELDAVFLLTTVFFYIKELQILGICLPATSL